MNKANFSKKIVEWYHGHKRDLPWRNRQGAYEIWLSEIILQQTRVTQGLSYYEKFLQNYPHIKSLAAAKEQEVLRMWQGLGYYSRARSLHKCAREIVKKFGGKFPETFEKLKQLPGIGDYTAAAIASFSFHERVAVVDGNVYRVLARVFGVDKVITSPAGKKFFSTLAHQLLPTDDSATHNQAIMEFGALHCLPKNPKCQTCTFRESCFAFNHEQLHVFPVKNRKQKVTIRYFYYFVLQHDGKLLMTARNEKDIWSGLYDFPLYEESRRKRPEEIVRKIFARKLMLNKKQISKEHKHVLSHQIIFARFIKIPWLNRKIQPSSPLFAKAKWHSIRQIERLPKPVLISRYLQEEAIL